MEAETDRQKDTDIQREREGSKGKGSDRKSGGDREWGMRLQCVEGLCKCTNGVRPSPETATYKQKTHTPTQTCAHKQTSVCSHSFYCV